MRHQAWGTPALAPNAARERVRCDAPVATLALVENPNGYTMAGGYNLPSSPVPRVRLLEAKDLPPVVPTNKHSG